MCFTGKRVRARSSKDGNLENGWRWKSMQSMGSMAVANTGATTFHANISIRRPLGTVDLEEVPDSRGRAGAPLLWLSCEGQKDVWKMFSDNSYLSAILDRQGLQVAAPIDRRTMKAENFSPQLTHGFWQKLKEKNPKIVFPIAGRVGNSANMIHMIYIFKSFHGFFWPSMSSKTFLFFLETVGSRQSRRYKG